MDTSPFFIAVSIIVLLIIAILVFFILKNGGERRLTPLTGLAFGFVMAGIFFSSDRLIGYVLLGIGAILAVVDILSRTKSM